MKHLTPKTRALLLQQANERAYHLTIAFAWFALFFVLGAVVLFYRHALKRHYKNMRAKAERNRQHLTVAVLTSRQPVPLDRVLDLSPTERRN